MKHTIASETKKRISPQSIWENATEGAPRTECHLQRIVYTAGINPQSIFRLTAEPLWDRLTGERNRQMHTVIRSNRTYKEVNRLR